MTSKTYLSQVKKCDRMIENKLSEVQSLREMILSVTSTLKQDVVQSNGSQDKLGDTIAKIIDLENEINADIDRFVDLKREVMGVVDQLDSPFSDILYKRYFQYKKWEEIAVELNYSFRQVTRLHGQALLKVNDVL